MSPDIYVEQNLPEVSFAYKLEMAGCHRSMTTMEKLKAWHDATQCRQRRRKECFFFKLHGLGISTNNINIHIERYGQNSSRQQVDTYTPKFDMA